MSNGFAPVLFRQNDTPRENNSLPFILLALCIGGICSVYYLNQPKEGLRDGIHVVNEPTIGQPLFVAEAIPAMLPAAQPERPKQQFLLHIGIAEALLETHFTIDPLKGAKYIINYGDGVEETVSGLEAAHTYQRGGTFKVTLKASFNGQVQVLQTQSLVVATAIEIDETVDVVELDGITKS